MHTCHVRHCHVVVQNTYLLPCHVPELPCSDTGTPVHTSCGLGLSCDSTDRLVCTCRGPTPKHDRMVRPVPMSVKSQDDNMSQPWMQKHGHACSHPYDNPAVHLQPECAYPHNCRVSAPPRVGLAQPITSLPCPSSATCWQGQTCLHICFIPIWPHACLHACYGQAMPCGGMSTCLHICCVPALLRGSTRNPVGMPLCPNDAIGLASTPVCVPATLTPLGGWWCHTCSHASCIRTPSPATQASLFAHVPCSITAQLHGVSTMPVHAWHIPVLPHGSGAHLFIHLPCSSTHAWWFVCLPCHSATK